MADINTSFNFHIPDLLQDVTLMQNNNAKSLHIAGLWNIVILIQLIFTFQIYYSM